MEGNFATEELVGWGPGLGKLLGERRRNFAREELGRRKKEMGEEDRTEGRAKAKLGSWGERDDGMGCRGFGADHK